MTTVAPGVRASAERWGLALGEPLAGGSSSSVFAARDTSGRDVVLKLPAARAGAVDVTASEAAALQLWFGSGVTPRLIGFDHESLLLERVYPGRPMTGVSAVAFDDLVQPLADALQRLWAEDPGKQNLRGHRFQSQADSYADSLRTALDDIVWERSRRGEPGRGEPGLRRLDRANRTAQALMGDAALSLLHGDFIAKNLLTDDYSPCGWCAIDPLPYIGDPASEVASFAACQPVGTILETAGALAAATELDRGRVLRWTAVWVVHQVVQSWREDQFELEELITSSELDSLLL